MSFIRPEDYAVLRPVYENGDRTKRMFRYEVDNPPPTISFPDGMVRTCPKVINLFAHDETNRDASHWVEFRNGESVQRVKLSHRANGIVQWRTIDGGFDESWLDQGSSLGGNAHGCNERFFERWGTPTQAEHNPTMSGSEQIPYREGSVDQETWPPNPHFGPWPIYSKVTPTMIETAGAPLEWDAESHGGGKDAPVMDWTRRHLCRVEPFIGGRRHLHRMTFWAWDRLGWNAADPAIQPFLGYLVPTLHVYGRRFDYAAWLDIQANVETAVQNWSVPADKPPPGVLLNRRFAASTKWAESTGTDISKWNGPSPFPSGYACAMMTRTRDTWTVAVALKIHDTDAMLTRPTQATMIQHLAAGPPQPSIYTDTCSIFELPSKGTGGRVQGWAGHTYLVYTGPKASLRPSLSGALRDGFLDAPPVPHTVALEGVSPP